MMLHYDNLDEKQLAAIDHLYEREETLLVAPKGFGKCVVGYTTVDDLLHNGELNRVLVLSTAAVCTDTWALEGAKWSHLDETNTVCLTGESPKKRIELMDSDAQIVICNFELMKWLFNEYPTNKEHGFDGLLVDEITKLKSVGGSGYKLLRNRQLKHFKWRVGMSADPVAQVGTDIYGQMIIIDKGKRLGRNQDAFRRHYFMQMDYEGRKWDYQETGLKRLTHMLSDVIYTVDATEYEKDLPALNDYVELVEMPEDAREKYIEMAKDGFIMAGDEEVEAPNAAVVQGKMHQIANGAVYYDKIDGSGYGLKKITQAHIFDDSKICACINLVRCISTPVLIAYEFDFQKAQLIERLKAPVYSSKLSKKNKQVLQADWDAGNIPYMLVHAKSAGHGLNLQYGPGHTLVCLTYFWSADMWEQLIGRLRRRGQKSKVVNRYTIVAKDSLEDIVMKPRLDKREVDSDRFHDYLKELRK